MWPVFLLMNTRRSDKILIILIFALLPILIGYFSRPSFDFRVQISRHIYEPNQSDELFLEGCKFYEGVLVPVDQDRALFLWRLAAERGHATALHNLGVMYANGEGVTEDIVQAYVFFELASKLGSKSAYQKGPCAIAVHEA